MPSRIETVYRHPVKGLRPESRDRATLAVAGGIAGDRAFAFQFMDEAVPADLRGASAATAPWMSKRYLAVQHDWPGLARVVPRWDATERTLELVSDLGGRIQASVDAEGGRAGLARYLDAVLAATEPFSGAKHPARAPLRLIGDDRGGSFPDGSLGPVTLVLAETVAELCRAAGAPPDARRLRMNLVLSGAPAWSEAGWAGRNLRAGTAVLRVLKPVGRCANIDVDAESGARDFPLLATLRDRFGTPYAGMRCEVLEAGEVRVGDPWEIL